MSKRNNNFSHLPKMYSVVWCKIDGVEDYCINGDHEQCGMDCWIKVMRVIDNQSGNWKWIAISKSTFDFDFISEYSKQCILDVLYECSPNSKLHLNWSYRINSLPPDWVE